MSIRTLDLFCGAGGSSWGAQRAGAQIVGGVDMWPLAVSTYSANFPAARSVSARLDGGCIREIIRKFDAVDLLLASPECTSHTCARGSRERDEGSRETAMHVLDFVRRLHPRWLVLENVVNMRSWHRFGELLEALRGIFGRHGVSVQLLDAAAFGVPQLRRRLFILCDREQPPPSLNGQEWAPASPARTILDPAGQWQRRPLFAERRAEGTVQRAQRAITALGEGRPFLVVYYGTDGAGGWQKLDRPLRTVTTLDRFGLVEWDSGEPTLRMLQVSELRRAMGFDEHFRIDVGTRRDRIMLLGNGVCPPVMQRIVSLLAGPSVSGEPVLAAA